VLVEAMAGGVPVVASTHGGPAEIVRDGRDGLLVEVEDVEAVAGAVTGLLRDPARRNAYGAAGRERATTAFNADRAAVEAWSLAARVMQPQCT
jgi:glycosyltransferase involved in cell wall biosynthesis